MNVCTKFEEIASSHSGDAMGWTDGQLKNMMFLAKLSWRSLTLKTLFFFSPGTYTEFTSFDTQYKL